jgi:hypothetical protein
VNIPNEIDEETLMAYADGELDADQSAQIEQLLQRDSVAAARVAQHKALRSQLQAGLSAVLSEPVPEQLLNVLKRHSNNSQDNVVELSPVRQRKRITHRWSSREWGAMAASLIVGVVIGIYALKFNLSQLGPSQLVIEQGGALIAQGKLQNALTTQLASTRSNQPIQIGISFRNHAGEYCRSFAVQNTQALAGLACHSHDHWRVQVLTESSAGNSGEFRQAGSEIPTAVLSLIEQQISGEPLDASSELAAKQSGWK